MDIDIRVPEEERCDYLFLLVGGNPLPNAVVAAVLPFKGKSEIILVHSRATWEVARALSDWLAQTGLQSQFVQIDDSHPGNIYTEISQFLTTVDPRAWVCLNYTGGTKAMAVQTHRALLDWARRTGAHVSFSYLDAPTLRLYFDQPRTHARSVYLGRGIKFGLQDLLRLHRWRLAWPANAIAWCPASARQLALLCCDSAAWKKWREWIRNEVHRKCLCSGYTAQRWKQNDDLRKVVLDLPTAKPLQSVAKQLASDFNVSGRRVQLDNTQDPQGLCGWLDGKWLEHFVLRAVQSLSGSTGFDETWQNVEVEAFGGAIFEVDVVAIRGYQLFLFSCTTERDRSRQKLKLFEASVRAQQIGGEEARVALVCCTNDPVGLEEEMRQQLAEPGKVVVFGCPHLQDLSSHIENWASQQIGQP